MKKLLILTIVIPFFGHTQYFSGEITYEIKIIPKSDTVNLKKVVEMKHGTTASYLITARHYKSTYFKDGKYNYSYTYDDETKRMYDDYWDKPYVTFRDSRKGNFEYSGSKILKDSTAIILGHDCYLVVTESEYGTSKTYYSDEIKVDYTDFEGHKVGNWYNKLKEVNGAITLKTITEHESYFEIQEAIKIYQRKVKNKEFELPKKPIAASYTALDKQIEMQQVSQEQIQCYQLKVGAVSNQEGEKVTSYVSFLLQNDGEIRFVEPYEEDKDELYKVAIDIINSCGFKFIPGMIAGEPVDSQVYFPVEFLR
ncbi:hypothetical protein [Maribacter aestuarii]|uniref:hypothetical protein n=1 Tax=Maribacter aestuarii TaxID=1130723 RepID=UPI00248B626A|nr:hypothetical protein [Maribacter aestuarii]